MSTEKTKTATKAKKAAKGSSENATLENIEKTASSRTPKTPNTAKLLDEIMNRHELSMSLLDKMSGVSKGVLHKIINGEVNMSHANFKKLLSALPFTAEERKEFYSSFYSEMYGKNVISTVEKVLAEYNKIDENRTNFKIAEGLKEEPEGGFLDGKRNIYSAIYDITQSTQSIYTNFPFDYDGGVLDDMFYSLAAENKDLHLVHFIEFYNEDGAGDNISTYMRTLRYMNLEKIPVSLSVKNKVNNFSPLPYFVYGNSGIVFFGNDIGILVRDKKALDAFDGYVKQLEKDARPCGVHINNLFELKNVTSASAVTKITQYYSIQAYPCIVFYLSLDDIMAVAKPEGKLDLPFSYEQQVLLFYSYYENYGKLINKLNLSFCSVEGLDEFALTGRFTEAPKNFSKPFSPEMRIQLLDKVAESIKNDRAFVLDSKKIKIPDKISIGFDDSGVSVFGDDGDFLGSTFFSFVDTPQFISAFSLLPEYLINCGYVYEKENALRYIENAKAIARCQITEGRK